MEPNLNLSGTPARDARVLVLDRDPKTAEVVHAATAEAGYEILHSSDHKDAESVLQSFRPDAVLMSSDWGGKDIGAELMVAIRKLDRNLPVILLMDGAGPSSAATIALLSLGANDCIAKPIFIPKLIASLASAIETRRRLRTPSALMRTGELPAMIGKCDAMLAVYRAIGIAAASSHAVLVRGEIGTGKSLASLAVHRHSRRRSGNLHIVRCEEYSEEALVATLFGDAPHRICNPLGSTGETQQTLTSAADRSEATWIIENVDLASQAIQSKLLAWVREQHNPVNSDASGPHHTIVMTYRSPSSAVTENRPALLREDLFFELRGGIIELPPLRDRGGDRQLLIEHFVSQMTQTQSIDGGHHQRISPEALKMIHGYWMPGNITELRSILRSSLEHGNGVMIANDFLWRLTKSISPRTALGMSPHGDFTDPNDCSLDKASSVPTRSLVEKTINYAPAHLPFRSPDYWDVTVDLLITQSQEVGTEEHAQSENLFSTYAETIECVETGFIASVLRRTGGNLAQSARLLGMSRVSLRKKIHALGLVIPGRGVTT